MTLGDFMNKVEVILKQKGPMLSGDLAREYEQRYGVSNQTARQALSRAAPPVCRLRELKFDKNQVFYYLSDQYKSNRYFNTLESALEAHSRMAYTYINAFRSQAGVISKQILPAYTYSPISNVRGHRNYTQVVDSLVRTNIISELTDEHWIINGAFMIRTNKNRALALETAKNIITKDFHKWASECNLVAYGSGKAFKDTPEFAHFQWGYTAPSYIEPLFSGTRSRPGFLVADIIYGEQATIENTSFFVEKLKIVRTFKKLPLMLPVLIVTEITPEALKRLKEHHVLVVILRQFFSEEYVALLGELVQLLSKVTAVLNNSPELVYDLFEKLESANGRYNNMVGDLFELLVGSYFSHIGVTHLKPNVYTHGNARGNYKEIDLLVEREGKLIVVECKGAQSKLTASFTEKWITDSIPHIRRWIKEKYGADNVEFQLWSVGGFEDDALRLLQNAKAATTKYTLEYYNYDQMISLAQEHRDHHFIEIMQKHFSKKLRKNN